MPTKTILVTGGSGVLGSAFKTIEGDWPEYEFVYIASMNCDLTYIDAVAGCVLGINPDYIIHTAALSGGVGISAKHPATLLRDNVLMSINILEAARMCGVEKTIMTLSSGMYPTHDIDGNQCGAMYEGDVHYGPPHNSNYAYAHAKRLIDPLIRSYREEFGLSVIGLVPNGIFGENDYFGLEDCNMVAALISKFYAASQDVQKCTRCDGIGGWEAVEGTGPPCEWQPYTEDCNLCEGTGYSPIILWGDGTPLRELTYAKDLARAYMWALENYDDAQILNVGNTEEVNIGYVAVAISHFMKMSMERVIWDKSKPSGPYRKPTDNSRFLDLSNFQYTNFNEALSRTIKWYTETIQTNPQSIRTADKVKV